MTLEFLSLYSSPIPLLFAVCIVLVGITIFNVWNMTDRDYTKNAENYFTQQHLSNVEVKP